MKMCRKTTKNLILLITVTLILSVSLFLTINQHPLTSNTLTIPTQPTSPTIQATSTNPKIGTHLQQLLQTADPSTEYEMIIFFEKTVNYIQGIKLLKNLGDFKIISNYTILDGICIKAPIKMAETIAQQNYVQSIIYNEPIKLAPSLITTDKIYTKDTQVNNIIGANNLQTNYNLNGTGVVVAVLDTGINPHKDLPKSRINYSRSFVSGENESDLNGHGTAVAGIIGAEGTTAKGVAPGVTFLNLKVLNQNGIGNSNWLIAAIDEALSTGNLTHPHPRADIISLSLGDTNNTEYDSMVAKVNDAWNINNTIVVVAAGNNGGSFWGTVNYWTINSPGIASNIITVGSTGGFNYQSVSYFSSRGPTFDYRAKPDIVAPGEHIYTLSNDSSSYVSFSGTSASTPVVSGAIALLLDNSTGMPWLTPNTIKAAIMMTAKDLGGNPFSQGAGLINISRAFEYLQEYYLMGTNDTPPLIITPIRAITPPMTLSNLSDTILNLTIVVGNISGTPITNAYFEVIGDASFFTTLPDPISGNLNDTQIFVQISFIVPSNMSASDFSGILMFCNESGVSLFNITLSLTSEIPLWFYLLPLFFLSSYHPVNLWAIGGIVGVAAIAVIALVFILRAVRRKPKPPPEFAFEWGEKPPSPPEPDETDWFL